MMTPAGVRGPARSTGRRHLWSWPSASGPGRGFRFYIDQSVNLNQTVGWLDLDAWTYPAFAVPGQQVRFRLFVLRDGVPQQDTESIYVQDKASASPAMSTTQGPRTAETTDVDYTTRTWSHQQTSSVLLAGGLSPSRIRDKLASGGFTVTGTVSLHGRRALELTWSPTTGPMTTTTNLWVDDQTYLPLRSIMTIRGRPGGTPFQTVTTQYQILPPTPANLNLLTPPIPAGFTRTAKSPRF